MNKALQECFMLTQNLILKWEGYVYYSNGQVVPLCISGYKYYILEWIMDNGHYMEGTLWKGI